MEEMTEQEKFQKKLNDVDLLWTKILRGKVVPPTNKSYNSTWKKMSPHACKLYIMVWALTSTEPVVTSTGRKLDTTIELVKLEKLSGLNNTEFLSAFNELKKLKLILVKTMKENVFIAIRYEPTPEEIG